MFCIYCTEDDVSLFSRAHIFPEAIGGRISIRNVCRSCNSVLGHTVEAEVKKSLFFCAALDKLGIQPTEKAYRHIEIADSKTGARLRYHDDQLRPIPEVVTGHKYTGERSFVEERFLDWVRRNRPHWVDNVKDQFASGVEVINVAGEKFKIKDRNNSKVNLRATIAFPWNLVAKIAFEAMCGFGFPEETLLREFYLDTFSVYKVGNRTSRIEVSSGFRHRINNLHPQVLDGRKNILDLEFMPYHRVDPRVSKNGTVYLKINFFEAISFVVPIGHVGERELLNPQVLGNAYFFPIDEPYMYPKELEGRHKEVRDGEDASADVRWHLYSTRDHDD